MVAVEKQNDPLTLIHSDALSALRTLEDESVQCCVTSPPYWGLRDYGHESQIGLEKTPEEYVTRLIEIFRGLKRVLRSNGTLWLNLGDSYAGSWGNYGGQNRGNGKQRAITTGSQAVNPAYNGLESWRPPNASVEGLKPKDLVGIPWMVAFALRADGWYLRSDIIWSKPNPMPESVTDRPTRSHEYIFLLSKGQRYFYDAEAIKENCAAETLDRVSQETLNTQMGGFKQEQYEQNFPGKKHRDRRPAEILKHMGKTGVGVTTRNRRSVWTVTTKPFSDAHFATFPPDLIKPCILAGAPVGGVVLDPFAGSGTTGKVAIELGRKAILIEPKLEYVEMIKRRCRTTIGLPLAI